MPHTPTGNGTETRYEQSLRRRLPLNVRLTALKSTQSPGLLRYLSGIHIPPHVIPAKTIGSVP